MSYKILVQNSKRKIEAQKLFFELGYKWNDGTAVIKDSDCTHLVAWDDGKIIDFSNRPRHNHTGWHEMKELVISELKDMVVLKRNDLNDRNVYDPENPAFMFFLDSSKKLFFFSNQQKWEELLLDDINDFTGSLLPIEREMKMKEYLEVKEYLDPNDNYTYHKCPVIAQGSNWIEVPHGAEIAISYGKTGKILFWKDSGLNHWSEKELNSGKYEWLDCEDNHKLNAFEFAREWVECSRFVWTRSETENKSQWDIQVGGDHYKSMKIQPAKFALENKLDYCQANAIKYICRHESKNGKQDLEKAKHYIDLLIEHYYGNS